MDVRLPKLGEGAESGTVVSIAVKEGQRVEEGQTLLELENEKAVAPIPSPAAGVVAKLRVKEGDKISVGQIIGTIDEAATEGKDRAAGRAPSTAGQRSAATKPEKRPAADEVSEPETEPEAGEARADSALAPAASPSIRRVARDLGIDLRRVRGSERGGRIVMADLRAYIERLQKLATPARDTKAEAAPRAVAERIDFSKWGDITKKPMSPLRQTISRRLSESWNAIPHVTQFDEADITALNDLRKNYASKYEAKGGRLTLTSFALKAVVATLKKYPIFNSSLDEAASEVVMKNYFHIGLAVDTEQGLIVPVIRNVDKKNLVELSKELNELAEKARARKVSSDELQGGTFTISNQGGIGGAHFTPIINRPEVAILGLGRGALKPVVRSGKIEPRLLMPLALSYDHRLIDGASAARFMTDLVAAFETFAEQEIKI